MQQNNSFWPTHCCMWLNSCDNLWLFSRDAGHCLLLLFILHVSVCDAVKVLSYVWSWFFSLALAVSLLSIQYIMCMLVCCTFIGNTVFTLWLNKGLGQLHIVRSAYGCMHHLKLLLCHGSKVHHPHMMEATVDSTGIIKGSLGVSLFFIDLCWWVFDVLWLSSSYYKLIEIILIVGIRPLVILLNSNLARLGNPSIPGVDLIFNRTRFISLFSFMHSFTAHFINVMHYSTCPLLWWW